MRQLSLELVCSSDLALAPLLLLANYLGVDAQLENATVQLYRVLDPLEVLINTFHAFNLTHVSSDALWVFTNCIDLLL